MYIITDNNNRFFDKHGNIVEGIDNAFTWKKALKARNLLNNCSNSDGFVVKDTAEVKEINISCSKSLDDFKDYIVHINKELLSDDRLVSLEQRLSRLDSEVSDIQHAIEFNVVNVVQGYRYYKMLHDVLVERRSIKDEIKKINILRSTISESQVQSIVDSFNTIDNQRYTPRLLDNLFKED